MKTKDEGRYSSVVDDTVPTIKAAKRPRRALRQLPKVGVGVTFAIGLLGIAVEAAAQFDPRLVSPLKAVIALIRMTWGG